MGLNLFDAAVIIAYMAALAWIGAHFSKRQTTRDEYFLGQRNMHWLLVGGSLMATLLSTVTYLNTPGEVIRYGWGFFSSLLIVPLIPPVVNRLLLPLFAGLRITSAYEYLEHRFDARVRTLAALVFILRSLIWIGLIIYTASLAVAAMTHWDLTITICLMGLVTTFYTSAGGLRTVIWTDNLQLWILLGGAVAVPVVVAAQTGSGPGTWWSSFSQAGRADVQFFSWDPTVRITAFGSMLSYFLWNICTQGADQVAVQRYLSMPSLKAARRSVWVYAAFKVLLTVMLLLCGLALFYYYFSKSGLGIDAFQRQVAGRADKLMPQFIVEALPAGLSGLMVAALLAAAMSSLSSGINSISSVASEDFISRYHLFSRWKHSVAVDKIVSVAAGVVGVLAALAIAATVTRVQWNLVELTGRVNSLFVGPMGVFFFAGVLFPRVGAAAVLAGFLVGTGFSLYISFAKEVFGLEKSVSFLWVLPASFLFGMAAAWAAGFVFPAGANPRRTVDSCG